MPTLYVATNGLSVWSSDDLGETLTRLPSGTGLYSGSRVWSLLSTSRGLLAGTDSGIYLWDRAHARFIPLPSPTDCQMVTALASPPGRPDVILAGTQPGRIYRSADGGLTWVPVNTAIAPYVASGFREDPAIAAKHAGNRPPARHWTRVTQIVFDPNDGNAVWAGVEIDGAWRSFDAGQTWERCWSGPATEDVHGFAVVQDGGRVVYATTNRGTYVSRDDGASWQIRPFDSPWSYTRSIEQLADGGPAILMTNGEGAPGNAGRLYRSGDLGHHWSRVDLPGTVESSVYFLATNPADPTLIFAAASLGQLYRSRDSGETWSALPRRLGEIRAIAWLPD